MSQVIPLVSVIMNCRNSDAYLKEAIDSVYSQTFTDWEIIFFDNQSTDDSAAIAQSYDAKLRYILSDQSLGLGAARNAASSYARGRFLCFLDCDDVWLPTKLEKQIQAMLASTSTLRPIGLSYTAALRIDSQGRALVSYARERKVYSGNIYRPLIKNCFMSCSSVMVTREAFDRAGGFDTRWQQVEDSDLWLRIVKEYDAAYVNEMLTHIRLHASNQSGNIFAHFSEKISLLEQIGAADAAVLSLCQQTITELKFHRQLAAMLLAREYPPLKRISIISTTLWQVFCHPVIFLQTATRYFNRDMIALFKYKFFHRTAS